MRHAPRLAFLGLLAAGALPPSLVLAQGAAPSAPATPATAPDAMPATGAFVELPCADLQLAALKDNVTCGRIAVPERHASAGTNAVTLSLPVVILRATGAARRDDPVLYLHGGPGLATIENAPRYAQSDAFKALRATRDLVMFDQRGTGLVAPAVCPDFDAELARIGREAPPAAVATQRKRAAAQACRAHLLAQGRDPAAYTSSAIADDADAVRRALGYRQWNVLATSYGSFPAFELARRHPASVRAIVLNSPFPPNSPNRAEQLSATIEGLAALQARCDADGACAAGDRDLRKEAAAMIARLDASPLKTDDGRITGETFMATVWNMLVRGKTAPLLPEYLKRANAGDEATVRTVGEPFAGPSSFGTFAYAQSWLVNCHDVFPRPAAPAVRKALAALPDFAPAMDPTEQDTVCDVLQPGHAPAAFYDNADLAVPTLVYAGEYDPATPTSDADATMQLLSKGTLVRVAGASHAPMGTDDCTLGIAHRFLADPAGAPDLACLAQRPKPAFPPPAALDAFLQSL